MRISPYAYGTSYTHILIWDAHTHMGQHLVPYESMSYIVSQLAAYFILHLTCRFIVCYTVRAAAVVAVAVAACCRPCSSSICMELFDSPCIRIWACPIRVYCSCEMHIYIQNSPIYAYGTIPYTYTQYCCCRCPCSSYSIVYTRMVATGPYAYGTVPYAYICMELLNSPMHTPAWTVPYVKMRCFTIYPDALDNSQLYSTCTQLQLYLSQTLFDSRAIDTYSYIQL